MFKGRQPSAPEPQAPAPGLGLRQAVLSLDPTEVGLDRSQGEAWAVVMDTGLDGGGWYSLVCIGDGTTSLYTSGGFGVIGAGEWPEIREASKQLLERVNQSLDVFEDARSDDPPPDGYVALRALTWSGQRWVVAPQQQLGDGQHAASPLFHVAHDVITVVRLHAESRD